MKYLATGSLILSLVSIGLVIHLQGVVFDTREQTLGATVTSTATSDTLETFRTNVNSSLTNLNNSLFSTTTTNTFTALQSFIGSATTTLFSSNYAQIGGTATTTLTATGRVGIGSSTPVTNLSIGTGNATSTTAGGYFCSYFQDEKGRGIWIKLSTSGNTVFSTSTTACNI